MTDKYDSNEGYSSYADSLKRKASLLQGATNRAQENTDGENEESNASQRAVEYVRELLAEKIIIDQAKMPNAARLIDAEIAKVQQMGRPSPKEFKFIDVYRDKPIKVSAKVKVPVREYPKFNFVGKLLGPKGNTLRHLQEETMCRMAILGKGSKKDPAIEEELRRSLDPKFAHLTDDLHVEISALGPPAEAHARMAFALAEIRKYLIPDKNDAISQQQMREMEMMTPARDPENPTRRPFPKPALSRPTAPPLRTAFRPPAFSSRPAMPAKTEVMSILSKIKNPREGTYSYEDDDPSTYEPNSYSSPPLFLSRFKSNNYSSHEYEPEYHRSSFNSYAEPASSTPWTKPKTDPAYPRLTNESSYRATPYTRPPVK